MRSYNKKFVYFICLVSAMGGLLFGYDWVVIGGAKPFYELYFDIADVPAMQGLAMSVRFVMFHGELFVFHAQSVA